MGIKNRSSSPRAAIRDKFVSFIADERKRINKANQEYMVLKVSALVDIVAEIAAENDIFITKVREPAEIMRMIMEEVRKTGVGWEETRTTADEENRIEERMKNLIPGMGTEVTTSILESQHLTQMLAKKVKTVATAAVITRTLDLIERQISPEHLRGREEAGDKEMGTPKPQRPPRTRGGRRETLQEPGTSKEAPVQHPSATGNNQKLGKPSEGRKKERRKGKKKDGADATQVAGPQEVSMPMEVEETPVEEFTEVRKMTGKNKKKEAGRRKETFADIVSRLPTEPKDPPSTPRPVYLTVTGGEGEDIPKLISGLPTLESDVEARVVRRTRAGGLLIQAGNMDDAVKITEGVPSGVAMAQITRKRLPGLL